MNFNWDRRILYLTLSTPKRDSTLAPASPLQPYRAPLLDGIALSFHSARGWRPPAGRKIRQTDLEHGEPRYTPAAFYTEIEFALLGSGAIDSVRIRTLGDSSFARDLIAAIEQTAARGDVFLPFGEDSVRAPVVLGAVLLMDTTSVFAPLFSLEAPMDRPVDGPINQPIQYPDIPKNWRASLTYSFVVDDEGRVEPRSIRNLRPPDRVQWPSNREREIYHEFTSALERNIMKARYRPAEVLGCRVRQRVQQGFDFDVAR